MPAVVIEHPIQDATEEELAQRAHELALGLAALLDQTATTPNPNA